MSQASLDLTGGDYSVADSPRAAAIARADPLPPGPYSVGLTHWHAGDGTWHDSQPYTVVCGDGRAVAGHIESLACAHAIADSLNRAFS